MKLKGYIYAFFAAASYGTNPIFAKPLFNDGMNPDSVLLFRYLLALVILGLYMVWSGYSRWRKDCRLLVSAGGDGQSQVCAGGASAGGASAGPQGTGSLRAHLAQTFEVNRHTLPQLIVLGILMAVSSLTLFVSYNYMPVGIASTLLFVYPIMTALIMMLCFGERLSWLVVACLLLACSGIALLCPFEGGALEMSDDFLIGFIIVMFSGLSYAIYLVGLNKTRVRTIASIPVTFYVLLFGTLLYIVRIAAFSTFTLPTHWYMWFNLLALGIIPTVISLVLTALAIQNIGSTQTALLGAMEPVTAVVLGVLVLGESVTEREVYGMLLIFLAVTLVVCRRK